MGKEIWEMTPEDMGVLKALESVLEKYREEDNEEAESIELAKKIVALVLRVSNARDFITNFAKYDGFVAYGLTDVGDRVRVSQFIFRSTEACIEVGMLMDAISMGVTSMLVEANSYSPTKGVH